MLIGAVREDVNPNYITSRSNSFRASTKRGNTVGAQILLPIQI
jgi:hypothetical protein